MRITYAKALQVNLIKDIKRIQLYLFIKNKYYSDLTKTK